MMMGGAGWSNMPPVVKNLLILNVLMYLASFSFMEFGLNFWEIFGLHYFQSDLFKPYQLVTYMFMHSRFDITHLFFNMFAVWMFGTAIEGVWGSKRFLIYYLLTGFGAAFLHYGIIAYDLYPLVADLNGLISSGSPEMIIEFANGHNYAEHISPRYNPEGYAMVSNFFETAPVSLSSPLNQESNILRAVDFLKEYRAYLVDGPNVVGASGSLFGILLAFGMMFPNVSLYLMFIPIPIKAKYFVAGYGIIELYSGFSNSAGDNVAHFAHIGGMLFGFLIIKIWQKAGIRWR